MKFLQLLRRLAVFYLLAVVLLSVAYLLIPPVSTLMAARLLTLQKVERETVSLEEVSPQLLRAVIRAEDAKFCRHHGVDWQSMKAVLKDKNGPSRGASTISMQVAKNLFLWPQRSYIRKALEVPIAMFLDMLWSKKRMMEVYLSVAEWGDGIFGIEAAAQTYFKKSAKQLSSWEAARLAAMLPNPLKRHPAKPSKAYLRHSQNILKWANSSVDLSCLR